MHAIHSRATRAVDVKLTCCPANKCIMLCVFPLQIYEDDFATRVDSAEKDLNKRSADVGQRRFGSQQRDFLSSLWGRWHQKASNKDVVELMEFAGGLGNEENVPPRS